MTSSDSGRSCEQGSAHAFLDSIAELWCFKLGLFCVSMEIELAIWTSKPKCDAKFKLFPHLEFLP